MPGVQVSPCRPIAEMPVAILEETVDSFISQQLLASPLRLKQTVLV